MNDQLQPLPRLEDGLEALEACGDRATQGRGDDQFHVGMVRKLLTELAALFVAQICEDGIGDNVVCDREIVDCLD